MENFFSFATSVGDTIQAEPGTGLRTRCAMELRRYHHDYKTVEGIIEYVNGAFESLTGYSSEKAVGQTPSIPTSGRQAPALYRELRETISPGSAYHNILVEVVMPRIKGGQLVKNLTAIRPGTRVLSVSGYAGQTILDHNVVDVENNFLQKPFTVRQLAVKVRAVLSLPIGRTSERDCIPGLHPALARRRQSPARGLEAV